MGWTQEYRFPSLFDLVRLIARHRKPDINYTDVDIINLGLKGIMPETPSFQGLTIIKMESIKVDVDQFEDVKGWRVTLSDGDVYETVLLERYVDQESGNYGCDIYEWRRIKWKKLNLKITR